MPPPVPPMVKAGRMIAGRPIWDRWSIASARPTRRSRRPSGRFGAATMTALGFSIPSLSIASRNSLRSSAISMASRRAPISSTPYLSSTPMSSSASAVFSPVCPPIVGSSASGRSLAMMRATTSGVIGST